MKKLSKDEMKMVMGGLEDVEISEGSGWGTCCIDGDCGGVGCRQWVTCNGTFTKC